ncbi:MAG: phosphoribosylanthranilate isomerase [Candidatus Sumerlaeaceae bacterium]|nr:phosphoribosylanthranilate isomerase [Candidatus Sumerlaeaceae bacterium]
MAPAKVKICGITNTEDAFAAAEAGADFLGYVFHPVSKRNVDPAVVHEITSQIRRKFPEIRHVGVFVDASFDTLSSIKRAAGLDLVQLHGAESASLCDELAAASIPAIKVFKFSPSAPTVRWEDFHTDFYLCDTFDPAAAGGTGRAFDPALIPAGFPLDRAFIAGGLTPANCAEVVRALHPFALDVSSGVEASPGRKSHEFVHQFIHAAKSAA